MAFRKEVPSDEIMSIAPFRDDADGKDYRLPNNTRPISYNISLFTDIHLGVFDFNGTVRITIEAVQNSNEITIHSRQITIESISLYSSDSELIQENVLFDEVEDLEFLVIKPTSLLIATQQYIVEITYRGTLRDDNMGFYRSSYKDPEGETKWLATTQFEQTDARHGFPCYDEPQIRAKFTIEIKHYWSFTALSNTIGMKEYIEDTEYGITRFEETPEVQTYLIAFVVSDFWYIENNDRNNRQRVFGKIQSIQGGDGALALEAGTLILRAFITHLGVPYALPKMEQVAIPDFDAGAMENW